MSLSSALFPPVVLHPYATTDMTTVYKVAFKKYPSRIGKIQIKVPGFNHTEKG